MRTLQQRLQNFYTQKLNKVDWILLTLVLGIFFVLKYYNDIVITYVQSLGLIDGLFQSNVDNIYNYMAEFYGMFNDGNTWIVAYPITIYIIFAVWNFPIWVLYHFFQIDIGHPFCFLWCKVLLLIFLVGCLYEINRILKFFSFDIGKRQYITFFFLSSWFVVLPIFCVAAYDILPVYFVMCGIRLYLENDKINWKFILIMAIAISLKLFAVLVFVPLVILKEKRIIIAGINIVAGILPTLVCNGLFYHTGEYNQQAAEIKGKMIHYFVENTWAGSNGGIPIFFVVYILICIYAYWKKCELKEDYMQNVAWIGAAIYISFWMLVFTHPYWVIYSAPFIVMLLALNMDKFNVILEMGMTISLSIYYSFTFFWVYWSTTTMRYLVFKLFDIAPFKNRDLSNVQENDIIKFGLYLINGIFIACSIALLLYNRPWKKSTWKEQKEWNIDRGLLICRIGTLFLYLISDLIVYFLKI